MPRFPIVLHIPKPCKQSWDEMAPTNGGRHCSACQQPVVDFTGMSDGLMLEYFRRYGEGGCGRFREDQLQRPLQAVLPPLKRRSVTGIAASAILMITLAASATAQERAPVRNPVSVADVEQTSKFTDRRDSSGATVAGMVCDESGTPIVNAYVELQYQGAVIAREPTDFDGNFSLSPTVALSEGAHCRLIARFQRCDTSQDLIIIERIAKVRMTIVNQRQGERISTRTGYFVPLIDPKPVGKQPRGSR